MCPGGRAGSRPPYYALALWPLGQLPYKTAYFVWELLSLGATAAFASLWPVPSRKAVVLACCWSLPLFATLALGQDVTFLLLWIALAAVLIRAHRPFAAGLILALCAAKFHLFWLLPLLIIGQRLWRFGAGLLAGGAALLALSFVAGGWGGPLAYVAFLAQPKNNPGAAAMPNLHGVFAGVPNGLFFEMLVAACVAAAV